MSGASDSEIEGFLRAHGPFEKPPILSCGERVGDWKVRAFLGRGGSAEVFRAENVVSGIVGALKVLYRTDDAARARFRHEARLIAETKSAAFPKFYGAGESEGRLYIAEELLEPIELPSDDTTVARYVLDVAAGVEELHRRGFVHRDLKPGNVLARPSTGESVLIDMGLAKEDEDVAPQARNGTLSVVDGLAVGVGTPGFSAPEQFTGGRASAVMDVHALGMLANACFSGKPPKAWSGIIRRSTSSIPEQRYASVADFARAVRRRHVARQWIAVLIAMSVVVGMFFCFYPQKDRKQEYRKRPSANVVIPEDRIVSLTNAVVNAPPESSPTNTVVHETPVSSPTNIKDLLALGKTKNERGLLVTRIALKGKDISLPGEIKLTGKRRIEISGHGRLTASLSGPRSVWLELSEQATLINLTTTPYPASGMKYILKGPCYLNFKNLDEPDGADINNIWVDGLDKTGDPSFRFRGPDSYEEVRREEKEAALDAMRKGIMPSY